MKTFRIYEESDPQQVGPAAGGPPPALHLVGGRLFGRDVPLTSGPPAAFSFASLSRVTPFGASRTTAGAFALPAGFAATRPIAARPFGPVTPLGASPRTIRLAFFAPITSTVGSGGVATMARGGGTCHGAPRPARPGRRHVAVDHLGHAPKLFATELPVVVSIEAIEHRVGIYRRPLATARSAPCSASPAMTTPTGATKGRTAKAMSSPTGTAPGMAPPRIATAMVVPGMPATPSWASSTASGRATAMSTAIGIGALPLAPILLAVLGVFVGFALCWFCISLGFGTFAFCTLLFPRLACFCTFVGIELAIFIFVETFQHSLHPWASAFPTRALRTLVLGMRQGCQRYGYQRRSKTPVSNHLHGLRYRKLPHQRRPGDATIERHHLLVVRSFRGSWSLPTQTPRRAGGIAGTLFFEASTQVRDAGTRRWPPCPLN